MKSLLILPIVALTQILTAQNSSKIFNNKTEKELKENTIIIPEGKFDYWANSNLMMEYNSNKFIIINDQFSLGQYWSTDNDNCLHFEKDSIWFQNSNNTTYLKKKAFVGINDTVFTVEQVDKNHLIGKSLTQVSEIQIFKSNYLYEDLNIEPYVGKYIVLETQKKYEELSENTENLILIGYRTVLLNSDHSCIIKTKRYNKPGFETLNWNWKVFKWKQKIILQFYYNNFNNSNFTRLSQLDENGYIVESLTCEGDKNSEIIPKMYLKKIKGD